MPSYAPNTKWTRTAEPVNKTGLLLADNAAIFGKVVNLAPGLSSAAANTAILQTMLNIGGSVSVHIPGIYYISSVLTIYSNTDIYLGAGVILTVADGSPSAIFTNSAARSTGVSVLGANATFTTAPDGVNYCVSITNMAGAGSQFPVNSWVSSVVLGHGALGVAGTAFAGRGYRGVYRVVESSANAIKYLIDFLYPGSAPSTNNLTLFPANENITIRGPGMLNGNGALADQNFNAGDPRGVMIWTRHAVNVVIDGLRFNRGVTWTVGSNYVRDYTVKNLWCELRNTPSFASIDLVHLSGNHQNVTIENLSGAAADNMVGMTIDCTEGTAFNFPYQSPGDMYDIKISNIVSDGLCEDGAFDAVALYGPAAYRYSNVQIDSVSGAGSNAVALSNYATTNQNKLVITDLKISNTRLVTGGAQVGINAGVFEINSLILDRIMTIREDAPAFVMSNTATGTIRSLVATNLLFSPYDGVTFTRTSQMVRLGGLTITAAKFDTMEAIAMAVNVRCIERLGSGTITKLVFQDISATGSGTGATYLNSGGGTAPTPVFVRSSYNGTPL